MEYTFENILLIFNDLYYPHIFMWTNYGKKIKSVSEFFS